MKNKSSRWLGRFFKPASVKLERFTYKGKNYRDHKCYPDEVKISPYDGAKIDLYLCDRSYVRVIDWQGNKKIYFNMIECTELEEN